MANGSRSNTIVNAIAIRNYIFDCCSCKWQTQILSQTSFRKRLKFAICSGQSYGLVPQAWTASCVVFSRPANDRWCDWLQLQLQWQIANAIFVANVISKAIDICNLLRAAIQSCAVSVTGVVRRLLSSRKQGMVVEDVLSLISCAVTSDTQIKKNHLFSWNCLSSPPGSTLVRRAVSVVRRVDIAAVGRGEVIINHCKRLVIVVIVLFIN